MITQVAEFLVDTMRKLFDCLIANGGYIGLGVVCMPLLSRMVRTVRSIIKH